MEIKGHANITGFTVNIAYCHEIANSQTHERDLSALSVTQ